MQKNFKESLDHSSIGRDNMILVCFIFILRKNTVNLISIIT